MAEVEQRFAATEREAEGDEMARNGSTAVWAKLAKTAAWYG